MDRRAPFLAATLVGAGLLLAGCSVGAQAARTAVQDPAPPAQVHPIAGTGRSEVVLSPDAAKRIGLRTEPVTAGTGAARSEAVIPLAALLYDEHGATWTYTAPQPLTFVPHRVVIAAIHGNTATLRSGPAVGTQVVTTGGMELLGAESGVPGEQ